MKQTPLDGTQLTQIRKLANMLSQFRWPGAFVVLLSFFESSPFWTVFIVLTAWIGVAMGLTGGPGFAAHLLQQTPGHRQLSKRMATIYSLGTFWIPTLATGAFGMVLASALGEDLRPQSQSNGNFLLLAVQIFAMYFLAAGVCWSIVAREAEIAQRELGSIESESSQIAVPPTHESHCS